MGKEEDKIINEANAAELARVNAEDLSMEGEAGQSATPQQAREGKAADGQPLHGGVAPELEEAGDISTSDGLAVERALDPLTKDDVERIGSIASGLEEVHERRRRGLSLRHGTPSERDVRYLRKLSQRVAATLGAVLVAAVLIAGCGGGSNAATSTVSDRPDQVVGRAIDGKPGLCDHIEMAVFLEGRGSAEGVFLKEWEEDGYQEQADGKEVFSELLRQCHRAKMAGTR